MRYATAGTSLLLMPAILGDWIPVINPVQNSTEILSSGSIPSGYCPIPRRGTGYSLLPFPGGT